MAKPLPSRVGEPTRAAPELHFPACTQLLAWRSVTTIEPSFCTFPASLPASLCLSCFLHHFIPPCEEQATQGQTTVLVVTSGTVKFDGDKQRYFNQNFLLTAQATPTNTVWKIAGDCFRFQDWAS